MQHQKFIWTKQQTGAERFWSFSFRMICIYTRLSITIQPHRVLKFARSKNTKMMNEIEDTNIRMHVNSRVLPLVIKTGRK
jgi:methyl coenzyme M reductase subunit D